MTGLGPALVAAVVAGALGLACGVLILRILRRIRGAKPHGVGVVLATAAAFVAIAAAFVDVSGRTSTAVVVWTTLAYLVFGGVSILLVVVDVDAHRLPDVIVLPAAVVALVLLSGASIAAGQPARVLGVVVGGAGMFVLYLVIRLVSPRGMGGGDVKLAGLIGLHLAFLGWATTIVGALAGFVLGGLFSLVLLITGRVHGSSAVAFGPWMLAGGWLAIVLSRTSAQMLLPV